MAEPGLRPVPFANAGLWATSAVCAVAAPTLALGLALGWDLSMPALPPWLLLLPAALALGITAALLVRRRRQQARRCAEAREQRFRRLLALAADGYWEIDQHYQLTAASDHTGALRPLTRDNGLGLAPWELPQWHCDDDTLDLLLADLDDRQPFRDVPLRWTPRGAEARHYRVSGEPRFDADDIFTGYWGVVRDITNEQRAQHALRATETRYRELFSRIPTPLVLHRSGLVFDANAAALALFGQPDLESMARTDLLAWYEGGDSRERARRRLDLLHGQPLGTALPVTDFKLAVAGRRLAVRATSVRVDAEGGPASLAIYVDDTERLAAEEAVRRSEAMLSHLVATSPDMITLTELESGRYAMVNRSFERISGWTAAEAVGRTAPELGLWGQDRSTAEDFLRRVREQGKVSDLAVNFVSKDGKSFSMVVSAAVFVMDSCDYLVINARDVTEKERERLEREAILLNASIGILLSRGRRVVLVNRHCEALLGWAPGELLGQDTAVFFRDEQDRAASDAQVGPALARGEAIELERLVWRRDGSTFLARVRGRLVDPSRPLESGVIWIVEDVTERRQFEATLARARDDAEAANRAKSAFLANTSHELRTPLNGLIGLARLAREDGVEAARRAQYLEQIEHSAQSLAAIISDILDLSRIEAGKLPIEVAAFDLGAELRQLQRGCAVLAESHGLALRLELDDSVQGRVQGDAMRVRQIVNNFLVNAIKFTEQGAIWLRASRLAGERAALVRIEVQDTGPGIAPATLARLFKPFTQADESTTRRFGGTGLGLSICRELAGLMGGCVGADSHERQGSTFWAELPLPPLPAAAAGGEVLAATAAVAARDEGRRLAGLRVLMAEDNAVNMMIAVAMLERWGVEVTQALDGRDAVAAVQRAAAHGRPFDALLMDVQMPVMSGHEATRALRELEAVGALQALEAGALHPAPLRPTLPIIALTAAALVTERDEALRVGMNDFLTKPIDPDKLHAALVRWCGR